MGFDMPPPDTRSLECGNRDLGSYGGQGRYNRGGSIGSHNKRFL